MDHTVAVPAAFGLRGCELFAEFPVSYRHGGASRAGAATTRASVRVRARALHLGRSCSGGGVAAATEAEHAPPAPADRRRPFPELFWAAVSHGSNGQRRPRSAASVHRWSLRAYLHTFRRRYMHFLALEFTQICIYLNLQKRNHRLTSLSPTDLTCLQPGATQRAHMQR